MAGGPASPALARAHEDYLKHFELHRGGRESEAHALLLRAANAGHPGALYNLGVLEIEGPPAGRDADKGMTHLSAAAAQGHSAARQMLAVLAARGVNSTPDWPRAQQLVLRSARADDPGALRDLAFLVEMTQPGSAVSGALLHRAACLGDALAAFAICMRTLRGRAPQASREEISFWASALKRARHPRASQLPDTAVAAVAKPGVPPALSEPTWTALEEMLAKPPQSSHATAQLFARPRIVEIKNLLSVEECEYVIGLAAPLARESKVYNNATGTFQRDPIRTASEAPLWASNQTLAVHCLNLRMSAVAGAAPETGEMLNVLKYERGQEFRPHFDFFDNVKMVPDYAQSGQRVRTLLTYLNDDFEGGPTHFLAIDFKYRGRQGDAVLFFNTDEAGTPDRHTLHSGMPVDQGVKWLASKWYRERAYG